MKSGMRSLWLWMPAAARLAFKFGLMGTVLRVPFHGGRYWVNGEPISCELMDLSGLIFGALAGAAGLILIREAFLVRGKFDRRCFLFVFPTFVIAAFLLLRGFGVIQSLC
jgi:hypothetical protein